MIGILVTIVFVAALGARWWVATINRFARLAVKVQEAASGIDVALVRRWDTLTKMLDVTKGYAAHEAETLKGVVMLRQGMGMQEKSDAAAKMDEVAGRLNILAESYPELRSSETFQQLQRSVMEAEGELQAARRIYNMNVSQFDQLLASWPAGVVGRKHGHVPAEFFEAEPTKRGDVKMAF